LSVDTVAFAKYPQAKDASRVFINTNSTLELHFSKNKKAP